MSRLQNCLGSEQRYWPTDREVLQRSVTVPLALNYGADQVRFLLTSLEAAQSGRASSRFGEAISTQRVLPTKLSPAWRDYLRSQW